jgi:PAS domain S-box-containing protein
MSSLLEARSYADSIVQTVREPLLVLDADLRVKTASRSFYKFFKVTPEDTLGRLICELGKGQWDIPALRELLDNVLSENAEFDDFAVDDDFPAVGQRRMLLSGRRLRDEDNLTQLILLAFENDVSPRRQMEHGLEVSEVRYRRLFESAHDGILILNAESGMIEDVNPFMLHLLDFTREHFLGKQLWEIGVFRDAEASKQGMDELRQEGHIRYDDLPLEDRAGRRVPVEFVSNVYQEGHQTVIQCNIRDISGRKRHERERDALLANEQAARMEAEAANRTKDLFLATLSHEMRTPLNSIISWTSLLLRVDFDDPDFREGIEAIDRGAKAQARLIEDVLDVSRIVSGKLRLAILPCQLVKVITAALEIAQPAAEAKGVRIETELDPSAGNVSCDPGRIQQVIWNLVSNAVKFTARGGAVRVTLARGRSTARIQVIDNGRGIEPEFLPHVFDRFRQADSTTRRKFGGLGLGLSIAKQLTELHGGTLKAESAGMGAGATFTADIPLRAIAAAEDDAVEFPSSAATLSHLPEVRLDGLHVLIVDDEPDARTAVLKVLQGAGAIVAVAGSVEEAMRILSHDRLDVLVSDIAMPDEDGYDLIRKVRAAGHTVRDLPAIALTAFAHKEDQRRVLLAGFQVHVAKPVNPYDLTTIIGSLVGRTGRA